MPDSPTYTFRPPIACTKWDTVRCPEGLHKSIMFQHGCPHHCGPPGALADPGGATDMQPPNRIQFFHFRMFLLKSTSVGGQHPPPPNGSAPPTNGKSWIRNCPGGMYFLNTSTNVLYQYGHQGPMSFCYT